MNRSCTWPKTSSYPNWPVGAGSACPRFPTPHTSPSAPDWVCEILSPGTRRLDLHEKRPVYAREGVSRLWLVDPADRTLEAFELQDEQWLLIASAKDDEPVNIRPFDAVTFSPVRPLALTDRHATACPAFKTGRPPTPCGNDETLPTRPCSGFRSGTVVSSSGFRVAAFHAVPVLQLRGTFCPARGKRIRRSNAFRSPYHTYADSEPLQPCDHIRTCCAPGPVSWRFHHNLAATCRDWPLPAPACVSPPFHPLTKRAAPARSRSPARQLGRRSDEGHIPGHRVPERQRRHRPFRDASASTAAPAAAPPL